MVSKARSYFFTSPKGLVSFRFLKTNYAQFSHAPENDTTEDNTTLWSLMNFLALLWVGNFYYIWYKIIDHGGIGCYETRVIPDGHPREGEIYIIMKTVLAQLYCAHPPIQETRVSPVTIQPVDTETPPSSVSRERGRGEGFTRYDPASGY